MRSFPWLAAAALLIPGVANASSLVLGSGLARSCFEAADDERTTPGTLDICNRALIEEALPFDDQVATYVNRGIIRARLNDWTGAMADYDRAIRLKPSEPEAYLNKAALVLKSQHDWSQARALFDAALERQTRRPEFAYYGRAVANELAGDYARAFADYQKASVLAPAWDVPKKELARFSVRKPG
ncbi:tetratricopeptide repeat protein [Sphingomonas sp. ID1715]|uniref:tetratricopeptide repeat protein n=1 Tax=Sphingomonas sp. ID1715 TaxID=1656898 RepID=UPI0014894AD4|nr:tetratricopeptide repeat protein [Sphingomonas sp. ID1715]NNM76074.1 tetratricopeptide repeat protein [Sphingomonas sp. ID1715]